MNTDLMTKLQTLIYFNLDKLEHLVEALESVCKEGDTKPTPTSKHPLDGYIISHKDIGSIIYYGDEKNDNLDNIGILDDINRYDPAFRVDESNWLYAKPYTDPVKLHFKPFIATKDSRPPSELGDGTWVAMLMNTGDIQITDDPYTYCWESATYVNEMVIGYQVISFVNPVLGE